jgi:hypothetical protein
VGKHEFLCLGKPDPARQKETAAAVERQADIRKDDGHLPFFRSENQIGRQRDADATARRHAVERADDGFREFRKRADAPIGRQFKFL